MRTANIFNFQRFSIHDGPGIRTVVFFKGCPLKCKWCANPESQEIKPFLEVFPDNCVGCGSCLKVCENNAISFGENGISIDREKCQRCGKCAKECYSKTLKYVGEEKTVDEVVAEIKKDEVFYKNSNGGYTFSGGEPLMQGEFCIDVMDACADMNGNSAIETSGYGDTDLLCRMAEKLDLMFFDLKHMSAADHKKLTGVDNGLILNNLKKIQPYAKEIIVRTPVIPGYNDSLENIRATAEFCKDLEAVKRWELLPYHRLGEHKYEALGEDYTLKGVKPPMANDLQPLMESANEILEPFGKVCNIESSGRK